MSKHTAEPWVLRKFQGRNEYRVNYVITSKNGTVVALMPPHGPLLANGAVLAAAPDMLSSLREVRLVINADPTLHHLRSEPWWERLQAAIVKAGGERV